MKLLVTGAAGEFGRDLVPLLAKDHDVRATDVVAASPPCEFVQADLLDAEALGGLVEGRDAVVHLAAKLPTRQWTTRDYLEVNATASALLMEAAAGAGVRRVVYVSTVWATGHGPEEEPRPIDEEAPWRPICCYGLTKLLGEMAAEYYAGTTDLSVTVLRMCGYARCGALGPDGWLDWARPDWPELVFHLTRPGQKLFDPLDLLDVVSAALAMEERFARYVVGQQWPFQAEDAGTLLREPERAWERYYPGAGELFSQLGVHPPEVPFYYSVRRFCEATGWRQRLKLDQVARRYLARRGDRL